jgi:nanoRNase/pAp phosphatase (c-di-AMP/oligoRNAs hydrolase)
LTRVIDEIGGEVGGHEYACGATISRNNEDDFIRLLKKNFDLEVIKVESSLLESSN